MIRVNVMTEIGGRVMTLGYDGDSVTEAIAKHESLVGTEIIKTEVVK